ncbi:helicase-related protein [Paenibacillus anseongense]|uniref:helicase-related protein n=1 Tax=Paenibacillus anseongense TaxID=2682845 RepID=UPI003AEF702A
MSLKSQLIPKLAQTLELIEDIKSKGEKVLIFTEYQKMQDILRSVIRDKFRLNSFIINGMTERRQSVVDEFNRKSGFDVWILSSKAAGTGLTVTSAIMLYTIHVGGTPGRESSNGSCLPNRSRQNSACLLSRCYR